MILKKIKLDFTLFTYDIESALKGFRAYSPGEQYLGHKQMENRDIKKNNIICIAAKWYHKKEVILFKGENAVEEFDKEARKADVCLGKNSGKFDVKKINTERMMAGLEPFPEWMFKQEDLERQMRKYFSLSSQSLDFISKMFDLGGKEKMEWSDWSDIYDYELLTQFQVEQKINKLTVLESFCKVIFDKRYREVLNKGKKALKKMYFYNKKDVTDTEAALIRVLPYIELKHKASTKKEGKGCTKCGSLNICPTEVITVGKTKYQLFNCLDHKGYAGKATYVYDINRHKKYGKMG